MRVKVKEYLVKTNQKRTIRLGLGGKYVVRLIGEGSSVKVLGGFEVKGKKCVEVGVEIWHEAEMTEAETDLRGVVSGEGEIKIRGIIKVLKGAQRTNSMLSEKVLLLGDLARAEVVPDLEIEADDVSASHAAVVSRVDEDQVYYLMCRGIKREEAEEMIVKGFLKPVK